jgi:hypothetical protein
MTYIFTFLVQMILWAYYAIIPPAMIEPVDQSCPAYEATMAIHGLDVERFSYVMWRESRCDMTAINPDDPNGGSYGLMQINAIHIADIQTRPHLWVGVDRCKVKTVDDLLIGWRNICVAAHLFNHAGYDPWKV